MAEIEGLDGLFPLAEDEARIILGRKIIGVRSNDVNNLFLELDGVGQLIIYANASGLTVRLEEYKPRERYRLRIDRRAKCWNIYSGLDLVGISAREGMDEKEVAFWMWQLITSGFSPDKFFGLDEISPSKND